MAHYTPDQIASGIIAEGERRNVTEKGICIAISTGLVETNLVMYANHADPESLTYPHDAVGEDANSVGVFQQRDPWWGTCHDRMHVEPSAGMFYAELVKSDYNSDAHSPGFYAQQVQQSAYPDRYDERYPEACAIYDRLKGAPAMPLVGEKVLQYDSAIVPQETGYWCGPASAQVCLNIRGIHVPESQLAAECGTDEGGTDYVGLIERCLDPRLPEANYTSVDAPHDPPTQDERNRLWDGVKRSIDNGYGVIMNWVAPAGNYPSGIKGSASPSYGGGTVFHYVTCAGYDDSYPGRALWIADSGFSPFEYWISFDQAASLIPPKAACYANLPHITGPTPPPAHAAPPDYSVLGYEQLCGPVDPDSGYGTGWAQLGQNSAGQNLYVIDALSDILHLLEHGKLSDHPRSAVATAADPPAYPQMGYENLAGPAADGYGHGWAQLGGRSVTDAIAHIRATLSGGVPPVTTPPPDGGPTGRLAILTFSGTWAAPGQGFPSDVARACADVADEIPVQAPWSFGPIPPGDLHAPSYVESVQIGLDWAVDWILSNEGRPVILGGYSQGGECASRVRMEFEAGGRLHHMADHFLAGYVFGNPARHMEHTYYGGPGTPFDGIAQFRLPEMGAEWCELVDPGDLYATSARGLTGEIERDVYTLCVELQLHDMTQFAADFVANCIEIVGNLDGDAYDAVMRGAQRYGVDLTNAHIFDNQRLAPIQNKIISVTGIGAVIAACIDGLIFMCSPPFPTAAHCEYHVREVWPGQTYVGLAIQHVHDYAGRLVSK